MSISLPHIWPKPPGVSQICSQQREFKGRGTEPQVIYRFPNSNPKNFSNFPDQICSFFSTRLIIIAMCIHWVSNLCYCIWLVREVKWLARGHTTKCLVQVLKPSFLTPTLMQPSSPGMVRATVPALEMPNCNDAWACTWSTCHGYGHIRRRLNSRECPWHTKPWPHSELMEFSAKSMNAIIVLEWVYLLSHCHSSLALPKSLQRLASCWTPHVPRL